MRIESSKGDNTGSISGSLSANLDMERVPQGYYSLVLNSITIGVKGSITIAIPQLTWKVAESESVLLFLCMYMSVCVRSPTRVCFVRSLIPLSTSSGSSRQSTSE